MSTMMPKIRFRTSVVWLLLLLLTICSSTASATSVIQQQRTNNKTVAVVQNNDDDNTMKTFDWRQTNCNIYPFGSLYDFCGVLELCTTANNNTSIDDEPLFGYRQGGLKDSKTNQTITTPCTSPGPILRLQPGKKYVLTLRNTIPNIQTNLYAHGLHIRGDDNANNARQIIYNSNNTVDTGECIHYQWDIPRNHMGGTNWYHAHITKQSTNQVSKGAVGMIIVEDTYETLVPKDIQNRNGIISFLQTNNEIVLMANKIYSKIGSFGTWYGNGIKNGNAIINIKQDVWTRLRIAFSDPVGTSQLLSIVPETGTTAIVCPTNDTIPIAFDGVYTRTISKARSMKLPQTITSSSRIEIAMKCNIIGKAIILFGTNPIAQINVIPTNITEDPNLFLGTPFAWDRIEWIPNHPTYVRDLRDNNNTTTTNTTNTTTTVPIKVDRTFNIDLTTDRVSGQHFINGNNILVTIGNNNNNNVSRIIEENTLDTYTIGQVIEWNIRGSNTHPIHFQIHHVQLVSTCGNMCVGEYYTIIQATTATEICKVRLVLEDYTGLIMFHAYDLLHDDMGMSVLFNILPSATSNTTTPIPKQDPSSNDRMCYSITRTPLLPPPTRSSLNNQTTTLPPTKPLSSQQQCFYNQTKSLKCTINNSTGQWFYRTITTRTSSHDHIIQQQCTEKCFIVNATTNNVTIYNQLKKYKWNCGRCKSSSLKNSTKSLRNSSNESVPSTPNMNTDNNNNHTNTTIRGNDDINTTAATPCTDRWNREGYLIHRSLNNNNDDHDDHEDPSKSSFLRQSLTALRQQQQSRNDTIRCRTRCIHTLQVLEMKIKQYGWEHGKCS